MSPISSKEIASIVNQTLGTDIRDVQEKIAPKALRPVLQVLCSGQHVMHPALQVCLKCGATMEELWFKRFQHN